VTADPGPNPGPDPNPNPNADPKPFSSFPHPIQDSKTVVIELTSRNKKKHVTNVR
jgi:hypothetical protein